MKKAEGSFVSLDGEQFYKISNYDKMEDFFMTITSSSDVWNFCWSQGGITAGRIDCDHEVFPYYTADKVSDLKNVTGPYFAVAIEENSKKTIWEPFASLFFSTSARFTEEENLERNIYKNSNGSKIWFEEINKDLGISFRYGWTSSAKFGLVKLTNITDLTGKKRTFKVLDGCRNIMPANSDNGTQVANSVLLDAYKKTDLDLESNIALYTMSSVLTDKAEPSEGLRANVSWFTTSDRVLISDTVPVSFFKNLSADEKASETVVKGERPASFIIKDVVLEANGSATWEQVFDTWLTVSKVINLKKNIANRAEARKELLADIEATDGLLTTYLKEADGLQHTAHTMTQEHHRANVMFNIMRGGFFADNGKINVPDFLKFIGQRNKSKVSVAENALSSLTEKYSISKNKIEELVLAANDPQLTRLYLEYMPIIFSRRHGDPSRPWNRFNIKLIDDAGDPILNYEGNWRDIFQNWEALSFSYPAYIKNMVAKFLNAMTSDGFNPYRINREGIDWECPEPNNPWAQYGYWGDHQVIYLTKLIEMWNNTDSASLLSSLDEQLYTSSNVPYRLKSYAEICKDPRSSLLFDAELSDLLKKEAKEHGSDKKLMQGKDGQPYLLSLTAKLLQIVIMKACNLVPAGGIWMNTQRPEWNDANNALAGWGLSVVTLCYLHRMIDLLIKLYSATEVSSFTLPTQVEEAFSAITKLYKETDADKAISDDTERKTFTDKAGMIFEKECQSLYTAGYDKTNTISKETLLAGLNDIMVVVKKSIAANKRSDGLYHTYNTLLLSENGMAIKNLQEMLEGQVAILSAGILSAQEVLDVTKAMKASALYEPRQTSYILYPNKELPLFMDKNLVAEADVTNIKDLIARTGNNLLEKDSNGNYHFNDRFNNARIMQYVAEALPEGKKPTAEEEKALLSLYEKTFNHQNFTGRSGTFYAYEGLGSIYWHMVSKLLLAVQENAFEAYKSGNPLADELKKTYYEVRSGLSFNKTPELYGAFPADPYSHTPYHKGAKQPGMTGQVKEEVLTRWGELGVFIKDGQAIFNPLILNEEEFDENGKLSFTWCGTDVSYAKTGTQSVTVAYSNGKEEVQNNGTMTIAQTKALFQRDGLIKEIKVTL